MEPITATQLASTRYSDLLRTAETYRRTHPRRAARRTGRATRDAARSAAPGLGRRLSLAGRSLLGLGRAAEPAPCC